MFFSFIFNVSLVYCKTKWLSALILIIKIKKSHKKTGSKGVCSINNHREIQHICRVYSKSEHDFYMYVTQFKSVFNASKQINYTD